MCYEQKEARNGVVREGQGLGSSEEDESSIAERTINVNNGPLAEISQQQPQCFMIHWERFLPSTSIKVLLVENDDSTRHVVSALLRNCSYEVTAVANGLQAWKVLEDPTNNIDIVLTEEAMPVLSGSDLLGKIMNHKTLKSIPVIMMSAHDSIGLVFQCLSKGAVDFLVKPIRKNELKNLWQHVWRRCHSSSGSGSESGTQSKKSIKSKSHHESENYAASSDEHEDSESDGLIIRDGSENGSGTQCSWTIRAAEAESSKSMSCSNQLPDAPDSTCAKVVHVKPEKCRSLWACITEKKECQEQHERANNAAEGKDLEASIKRNPELQRGHQRESLPTHQASIKQNGSPEAECKQCDVGQLGHENENITGKDRTHNIITATSNSVNQQAERRDSDASGDPSDIPQVKDGASHGSGEIQSLELTLKGLKGAANSRGIDKHNVFRHSDLSAFSKYSTASSADQAPTGNVGSCSLLDNSSVTMKTETVHNFPSHSNGILLNKPSIRRGNKNDMITTVKCVSPKPEAFSDKYESISAFKCFHSSPFQPMQNGHICSSQEVLTEMEDDTGFKTAHSQMRSSNQEFHLQHQVEKEQHHSQPDHDASLKIMAITATQCRSSNVIEGPSECNIINYSLNGSTSGSNYGSNGPNGSSTGLNAEQATMESDNGAAGAMSGRSSGSGADEDRVALRVAALTKFRQKRKERCFEKRVRYQSRKKLAEQRPRVKGQFVRRIMSDTEEGKDCSSNDLASEANSSDGVR